MRRFTFFVIIVLTFGLLAASCSDSPTASTAIDDAVPASDAPLEELTAPPGDQEVEPEPDDTDPPVQAGGDADTAARLEAAFASLREFEGYRTTTYSGQRLRSSPLGVDVDTAIDLSKPASVVEVDGNGNAFTSVDLTAVLGALGQGIEDVGFDMYFSPDRMIMDTRRYQPLVDRAPSADLGPFAPGVSSIDLSLVPDGVSTVSVAEAMGVVTPDPAVIADGLAGLLENAEVISNDPLTVRAVVSFEDALESSGQDLEVVARNAAAGVSQSTGIDPVLIGDLYIDFYRTVEADLEIEIGDDNAVRSVRQTVDLSGIFTDVFSRTEIYGDDQPTAAELAEVVLAFSDTIFIQESLSVFESVPGLVLPTAPEPTEDRTTEVVRLLQDAGLF